MGTTGMNATLGMTGMGATPIGDQSATVPFSPNSNKKVKNKKISPRDKKINKISFRGEKDTAAATADNFGTVYTNNDQSTYRPPPSQGAKTPMFNKKELVLELKTAMRAELDLKLKTTQKEFIDLKFKVNKLNL